MRGWIFAAAAVALAATSPAGAQSRATLFETADPLHLTIQAPLQTIIRNRSITAPIAGTLTDSTGQALPVNLTLRGHVNRTTDVCEFPPIRVEFSTPPPPTSVFAGQKKLKLVTHCQNNPSNQQYILLDYTAYRMYNLLTPRSFRVRLATVDYRGADGRPIISRVGFFIEDERDVAKRNGLKQVREGARIPLEYLSSADAARYALFEHMISNHDWSMRAGPAGEACCHNAKLIGVGAPGLTVPIPYDFDFSGFVDAPYATVPDQLHISSVRTRVYRGYCAHNSQVMAAARQFREARPQLIAVIGTTPGLEPRMQQRAIAFLDPFFSDIASDQSVSAKVLSRCAN